MRVDLAAYVYQADAEWTMPTTCRGNASGLPCMLHLVYIKGDCYEESGIWQTVLSVFSKIAEGEGSYITAALLWTVQHGSGTEYG